LAGLFCFSTEKALGASYPNVQLFNFRLTGNIGLTQQGVQMQDHGQIARAFAAWQRAHKKLCDAEDRLAEATVAYQEGRRTRPDELREEVLSLRAEQDWRYTVAADALRRRNTGAPGAAASAAAGPGRSGLLGDALPQPA
jgi:hypothetical protein